MDNYLPSIGGSWQSQCNVGCFLLFSPIRKYLRLEIIKMISENIIYLMFLFVFHLIFRT